MMTRNTILITGGTGFIGSTLISNLPQSYSISSLSRHQLVHRPFSTELLNVDTVIHLAGRAHVINEANSNPLEAFREINTACSLSLARQAAIAKVRRFIFISSIGVNGDRTFGIPFSALDKPIPCEPYAISKHEAEIGLHQIAAETGMEVVIIRPPLVYGASAPGNFGRLLYTVFKGVPLPLGAIHNKRSFVAVENLISLISTCIRHPSAANQTFLVSDGEDLSTTAMLTKLGAALGKPSRLIPVPQGLLSGSLNLLGKKVLAQSLCGSLQVDISKTCDLLNWAPPLSVDDAINKTAQDYLSKIQ